MNTSGDQIKATSSPRYAQLPTFMRLGHQKNPEGYDCVVIGAPYDGGTSYRPGARFGPNAIRAESVLLHGTGVDRGLHFLDQLSVCDGGDLDLGPYSMELAMEQATTALSSLASRNRAFLLLGGDHSISLAGMRAANAAHGKLAVLHLDAHSDTYPPIYGAKYHHGTPFRWAIEEGIVDPSSFVQIGIRGHLPAPDSLDWIRGHGGTVVTMDDFDGQTTSAISSAIVEALSERPLYVSCDIDVVDPAYAPGTGTPAVGGMTSREVLRLLKTIGHLNPVAFDVMEVCPPFDHAGVTSLLAAEIGAEMLYQFFLATRSGVVG